MHCPYLSAYRTCCKSVQNWPRYVFCVFSKDAPCWISKKWHFGPSVTLIARTYKHIKFGANWSRIGQDTPFCVFSNMAAAAILSFQIVLFWTLLSLLYSSYISLHQIWCKFITNWPRYTLLCIFQDGSHQNVQFTRSNILGHCNPSVGHIYPHTKIGANGSIVQHTHFCLLSKMAATTTLNLQPLLLVPPWHDRCKFHKNSG